MLMGCAAVALASAAPAASVAQQPCAEGVPAAECPPLRRPAASEPTSDLKTDSLSPARPLAAVKTDRGGATTGPESASILASRLIGQGVYDARGVEIGQISDVVLTDALGGMGAVIRLSSLMGLSSREVLIPRAALSMRRGSDGEARLTATWSKEQIESAPVFDRNALMR